MKTGTFKFDISCEALHDVLQRFSEEVGVEDASACRYMTTCVDAIGLIYGTFEFHWSWEDEYLDEVNSPHYVAVYLHRFESY